MIDLPPLEDDGSVWVFGYGSLMWNPGFKPAEIARARLEGYQRRFCIYSVYHRGNAKRPGLVLGLDRGGTSDGLALRVAADDRREILAYLRAREQINGVYKEARVAVDLAVCNGEGDDSRHRKRVSAIAFTAERAHPSYAGRLSLDRQAALIRAASGQSGANLDYLFATLDHLAKLGIRDPELLRLLARVGPHFAKNTPSCSGTITIGQRTGGVRMACQRFGVAAPLMRPDQRRRFIHRNQIAHWQNQKA